MENTENDSNSFLGRGWSFPPAFFKDVAGNAGVRLVENEEDINQSLSILFSTALGERVMLPEYGADLHDLMFEGIDIGFLTRIKDRVKTAVSRFEPRIKLDDLKITTTETEGVVLLVLEYTINSTNTRTNMVYPFYIVEATNS